MIKFKQEFKDIIDVNNVKAFCFGVSDDVTPSQLIFAGGGSKFSALCGFKFISKVNPQYNHGEFMIVFCAKLRSKIYRRANQNPSQWFAFLKTGPGTTEVLDKESCKIAFDFDIDKFFQTQLFITQIKKFENAIRNGIANSKIMMSKMEKGIIDRAPDYAYLPRYIKAIEEAVPLLGKAKFNDLKYTLTMQLADPNIKAAKKRGFDVKKFGDFLRKDQARTIAKTVSKLDGDE